MPYMDLNAVFKFNAVLYSLLGYSYFISIFILFIQVIFHWGILYFFGVFYTSLGYIYFTFKIQIVTVFIQYNYAVLGVFYYTLLYSFLVFSKILPLILLYTVLGGSIILPKGPRQCISYIWCVISLGHILGP